jgi:hypothetical protein
MAPVVVVEYLLAPHFINRRTVRSPEWGYEAMMTPVWGKK